MEPDSSGPLSGFTSECLNVDSLNVNFHPYINESGFICKEDLSLLPQSIYVLIQLFIAVWIFYSYIII